MLKLVLPWEELAAEATAVLGQQRPEQRPEQRPKSARWMTVDFLDVECANVLATVVRRGTADASYAQQSLEVIAALPLVRWRTTALLREALEIACAHGISVYDACYVALADALGVPLLTADQKLVRKLRVTRHAVVHLGEFEP